VISLGSNPGPSDAEYLQIIRKKIVGRVVWVLPAARDRDLVLEIAAAHRDLYVDARNAGATETNIHPPASGYQLMANAIRPIE
jgi:hypothetical protein